MCKKGYQRLFPVLWLASLMVVLSSLQSPAQGLLYPLYFGTSRPIQNEFGRHLEGSAALPPELCARVEILSTTNGIIYPPNKDGTPDPRNTVLPGGVSFIGNLTARGLTNPGIFAVGFMTNQPVYGAKLFARAFNASSREAASFYSDSEVFTNAGPFIKYDILFAPMTALDTADDDSDGLHNSWEESYGSNPLMTDSDGDGVDDGQEVRAGTSPVDANSVFLLTGFRAGAGSGAEISWSSVPGKRYQVEYTTDDLCRGPVHHSAGNVVTASGPQTQVHVPNDLLSGQGQFRVRLMED